MSPVAADGAAADGAAADGPIPRPKERIAALDLIRGVAILGILAVNIEGFAGPMAATVTPEWNGAATGADRFAFAATMLLFEGKMRALLSLLFGASLLLFIARAEKKGENGDVLQLRRLIWLAVIGYLHFLLWWGDILFTYALAGFFALLLRHLPVKVLVPAALLAFTAWHGSGMAASMEPVLAEIRLEAGMAMPLEKARLLKEGGQAQADSRAELQREAGGLPALVQYKLTHEPGFPLTLAIMTMGETLPLMLIGMALFRSGIFTGGWQCRQLWAMALGGISFGGLLTLALIGIAWSHLFPTVMMQAILGWWAAVPHLVMALGYTAALILLAQNYRGGWLGTRIAAVGRMALTNYLGCTLVFTGIFYGWGLGLIGTVPERWLWVFVLGGWIAMLVCSKRWLDQHAQGPVEWAWRSLTHWRRLPLDA